MLRKVKTDPRFTPGSRSTRKFNQLFMESPLAHVWLTSVNAAFVSHPAHRQNERMTQLVTVCYIVTFYRLVLLIVIFISLVLTAVCLFFIEVLQHRKQQSHNYASLGGGGRRDHGRPRQRRSDSDAAINHGTIHIFIYSSMAVNGNH